MLDRAIDWLQTTFPPNRIVVLLGGLLTAVSSTAAAWLAAHFPGLELGAAEIAGVLGAAALITIRLLDRWIDQWQRGENIDAAADVEQALADLEETPEMEALIDSLGVLDNVGQELTDLRGRLEAETIDKDELAKELEAIVDTASGFLASTSPPEPPAAVPAPEHHPV